MAMPVEFEEVWQVLVPWLGEAFCGGTPTVRDTAALLADYSPNRSELNELRASVESLLLVRLNRYTNRTLAVYMENGRVRQITRPVLAAITDDLMGLIFDKLTVFSANYIKLNEYNMQVQSLNAMRVLYQKYSSFIAPDEMECMIGMLKSIYPPACYQSWLQEQPKKEEDPS